ncbi:MAG: HD domain-containing protein [Marinifilaceae bacterium]
MDFEQKLKEILDSGNKQEVLLLTEKYLMKAYNAGWNDCLWGDEAPALDAQTSREILSRIKREPEKRTRNNSWERLDAYFPSVKLPNNIQGKYQKAIRFAGEKHFEQKMPGSNANYLVHLSNVAMEILLAYQAAQNFDVEFTVQLALLHDVLEDTEATYKELMEYFGNRIAKAVLALTKTDTIGDKQERMNDSIERILLQENEVGMVKLADRITNLQPPPKHWHNEKILKYKKEARTIFDKLQHTNRYLAQRLQLSIQEYNTNIE